MSTIRDFKKLEAWQTARDLTNRVYIASAKGPFRRDFALRDQIRRAAVSTMSNIAEGFESRTTRMFVNYLGQAKASAGEVRSQIVVALDQSYVDPATFDELDQLSISLGRQIRRFSQYLESNRNRYPKR